MENTPVVAKGEWVVHKGWAERLGLVDANNYIEDR